MIENQRKRCDFSYLDIAIFQPSKIKLVSSMALQIFFRHTFNCKLPDSYHYFDERGVEWSTTDCYLKGEAIRQLLSIILFIFYILILVGETIWWTSNVRKELYTYIQPIFGTYLTYIIRF